MPHRKGKKVKRLERAEDEFRSQAMKLARESLGKAIEWIDYKDITWATVMAERGFVILKAAGKV